MINLGDIFIDVLGHFLWIFNHIKMLRDSLRPRQGVSVLQRGLWECKTTFQVIGRRHFPDGCLVMKEEEDILTLKRIEKPW